MAFTMTHKDIAEELASKMMDTLLLEELLQRAYETLCSQYEDYTEVELLEAIEEHKEDLGMGRAYDVDDLLNAAEKNVELYSKSIAQG